MSNRYDLGIMFVTYALTGRDDDLLAEVTAAVDEYGWQTLAEDMFTIIAAVTSHLAVVMEWDIEEVHQELARFFATPEDERREALFAPLYGDEL